MKFTSHHILMHVQSVGMSPPRKREPCRWKPNLTWLAMHPDDGIVHGRYIMINGGGGGPSQRHRSKNKRRTDMGEERCSQLKLRYREWRRTYSVFADVKFKIGC